MHTKVWSENLKGSDHSEDPGIDRKIILEWILEILGIVRCDNIEVDFEEIWSEVG
jgi:hypothetical protein